MTYVGENCFRKCAKNTLNSKILTLECSCIVLKKSLNLICRIIVTLSCWYPVLSFLCSVFLTGHHDIQLGGLHSCHVWWLWIPSVGRRNWMDDGRSLSRLHSNWNDQGLPWCSWNWICWGMHLFIKTRPYCTNNADLCFISKILIFNTYIWIFISFKNFTK